MANEVATRQKLINSDKMQEHFAQVLKDNAPSFLSGLSTLVGLNPDLAQTNMGELTSTAMRAAVLDLSVLPDLGEAYVIPYGKRKKVNGEWVTTDVKPQFQLGYRGIIKLVQNTGLISHIGGSVVYEGHDVKYNSLFDEIKIGNEDYDPEMDKKANKVGYIAYYTDVKTGERIVKYWSMHRVLKHATEFSETFKGPDYKDKWGNTPKTPWYSNFDAMAIKTVMKDLLKFAPKTSKIAQALTEDDREERATVDVTPVDSHENTIINVPKSEPEKKTEPETVTINDDIPNPFADVEETKPTDAPLFDEIGELQ
ncbi:recombinase RecT [Leuconostoc gelidum]|uniref:recombinase RecT n=1 Tax=Leuconostoc gelidum TaxID=1244 RepID=UPI00021923F7|nr:recombinase RecT [Leuconostoc gelidum]GMA66798.1 putative recombinase - phage associated [Leuconostoc gelidum subsp. gelidum]